MHTTTIGGNRQASVGYELDDISLVPSRRTRDVELVDVSWSLDAYRFALPVLGAPLDAVVSPGTARQLGELGGLGVLALEGLWTRYEDPEEVLAEIASLRPGPEATVRLQQLYHEPVREELIGRRIEQLKAGGQLAAGSLTPQKVERYHHAALEAGLDLLLVNGVTVTAQHVGKPGTEPLDLKSFTARYDIPVVAGGVASAKSALHLMRTGAVGVLVGTGSSASTTADALGVHVPLATAIAEVAAARTRYLEESGRYVHVIAAGGIRTGGDLAKAIACGADAVMLGRALAAADEAPGRGAYWGLAAAHNTLPRSRFDLVEPVGPMQAVLEGPAHRADGTLNLVGGLRRAMGVTGYRSLSRLREAELAVRAGRR
ncbi:GuaB3 family IMP dehydrogenase-related protein [Egicoccus halophilus]|uniref:Guanosine monophosphate reductase n=1 Tax=Egicoccus halophilus TaxID=1670830 RepID=A0A8J3AA28_9ACTN|nr:GuaB3 family IMP dehydrogenase-related protein [Egicoccus halophilus]GGI05999.1 guanosine monophosphate reductase [Egicoccus halophilus]